ncbi:DNA mismatch repair protein, partial [Rhizopus stolonifer]
SDFFNWWDPSQEKLVYIDSKTGNTYNSISHDSHTEKGHQNKIDRSRLKRAKITQGNNVLNETKAISNWLVPPSLGIPNKLSKHDLQHVRVLGQVDKKYIAVKLLNNNLVMIDQHAADERVKLEELLKTDVPWQVSVLEPTIPVQLDSLAEYQIVTSDRTLKCLKMWGIHITATTNSTTSRSRFFSTTVNEPERAYRVYVTQLPSVIVDRCIMNHTLLKQVICDYAYWMMEQRDEATLVKTCPKGVVEILKSKACRSN